MSATHSFTLCFWQKRDTACFPFQKCLVWTWKGFESLFHSWKSLVGGDAVCGDDDIPSVRWTSVQEALFPVELHWDLCRKVLWKHWSFTIELGKFPCDRVWKSHSTRSCPLLGITSLCTEQTVLMSRGQISEVRCYRKTLKKFTNGGYFYFSSKLCMSYKAVY